MSTLSTRAIIANTAASLMTVTMMPLSDSAAAVAWPRNKGALSHTITWWWGVGKREGGETPRRYGPAHANTEPLALPTHLERVVFVFSNGRLEELHQGTGVPASQDDLTAEARG